MDKNTLIAVILSVIVITGGFMIQGVLFPSEPKPIVQKTVQILPENTDNNQQATGNAISTPDKSNLVPWEDGDLEPLDREIILETELLTVTFSTKGGTVSSLKLKDHLDNGTPLEMIQNGDSGVNAFNIYFGSNDAAAVNQLFYYKKIDAYTHEFYRNFKLNENDLSYFTLKKTYVFNPNDYMFELHISLENSINEYLPLDFNGYSYTLGFGPQIGPEVEKIGGRYEYRKYYTYENGKLEKNKLKNNLYSVASNVSWAAIAGKYFTIIGIPDSTQYKITFSDSPIDGINDASELFMSRPVIKSSRNVDVFKFFAGPKLNSALTKYNNPDKNSFGTQDLNLDEVIDTSSWLGWLEWILKKLLVFSYSLVPNYGVAIIIMTLIVKVVLFPFTHKSYESTSRMQALTPKINEIKEKFKDTPTKMNAEMADLYKREKVNPMGGCLPMLLQMPIFIALYGLLTKHFDLRGAVFIQGWITDLSAPESIFYFGNLFQIPFLGWTDIRLLPILFTFTMIISQKLMQSPGANAAGGSSMKMMTTLMPVMFFFMMYNAPSGLLLYWTITNLFTMIQQKFISSRSKKAKAS
ncbi:MAG: membrane protein insertase YidC [Spirochaetia bacterium]|nr:membrane protein insertase YidC [Spirochaetia bacterium]